MKSEFQNWWRSQTVHPSRLQPTVPICPCAACFNGTGHERGEEVFSNPMDPDEIEAIQRSRAAAAAASTEKPKNETKAEAKLVKKAWYKQAGSLLRKPSSASIASDIVPLKSTATLR